MTDTQPAVSEVTCKAAAALAASATGLLSTGEATEAQRAEAARLLRTAADMLHVPAPAKTCRCTHRGRSALGDTASVTVNAMQSPPGAAFGPGPTAPGVGSAADINVVREAQRIEATRRAQRY